MTTEPERPGDHASSWAPVVSSILPLLTELLPGWAVLKNHQRLPEVTGDVDLCVPRAGWDAFLDGYLRALAATGSYAVASCDHYLGVRLVFAASLDRPRARALEVDLADGVWWKGTRLLGGAELAGYAIGDPRGFRRLPEGVEAAYRLTIGLHERHGDAALRARALADPGNFRHAMLAMHGRAGARAAARFLTGEWPPLRGLPLIGRRAFRAAASPLARPAAFARRKAMRHWRGLPRGVEGSAAAWLELVSPGHPCRFVGTAIADPAPWKAVT
jgi:hypothetical protein